jgi:hypothetical protein
VEDRVSFGTGAISLGGPRITGWTSFTPTTTATNCTVTGQWRRVGDCIRTRILGTWTSSSTWTSMLRFTVGTPLSLTLATAKVPSGALFTGNWRLIDASTGFVYGGGLAYMFESAMTWYIEYPSAASGAGASFTPTGPITIAAGDTIVVHTYDAPVTGWAS